jgi:large subunit ribosomal protein L19
MSVHPIIESIEKTQRRQASLPAFRPGDSIKVWAKIREGEKTRLQAFEGVCIRRVSKGSRSTFTVRKISYGVGVERIFPDNSPNIDKIEVVSRGRVHQARLYYLRDLSGKAARIKEREGTSEERAERAAAAEAAEAAAAAALAAAPPAPVAEVKPKPKRKERKKDKDGNKKEKKTA